MKSRDAEFVDYVDAQWVRCRRMAYLLCGDWTLAEDIVQQAWIKLYQAWSRVRRDGADSYMRRIIARTAIDEWRRASRRPTVPDNELIDIAAPADEYEERAVLLTSLQQLPPRQRQVVVLRHWWGCSVAEVAQTLGVTTGTVQSQTAKALHKLNLIMTDQNWSRARP